MISIKTLNQFSDYHDHMRPFHIQRARTLIKIHELHITNYGGLDEKTQIIAMNFMLIQTSQNKPSAKHHSPSCLMVQHLKWDQIAVTLFLTVHTKIKW